MEKIIKIGDKDVKFSNNLEWTIEYREQFNKDVFETIMPIITSLIETVSTVVGDMGTAELTVEGIMNSVQGRAFDLTLPLSQLGFVDLIDISWAMAKTADPSIDPPRQWFRQFDEFPLDVIVPELGAMVMKGFVSSKNLKRLQSIRASLPIQPK